MLIFQQNLCILNARPSLIIVRVFVFLAKGIGPKRSSYLLMVRIFWCPCHHQKCLCVVFCCLDDERPATKLFHFNIREVIEKFVSFSDTEESTDLK